VFLLLLCETAKKARPAGHDQLAGTTKKKSAFAPNQNNKNSLPAKTTGREPKLDISNAQSADEFNVGGWGTTSQRCPGVQLKENVYPVGCS